LSTVYTVTKLVETVVEGLGNPDHTLGVKINHSKAFYCVCHAIFLYKMEISGVRGLPRKWLQ